MRVADVWQWMRDKEIPAISVFVDSRHGRGLSAFRRDDPYNGIRERELQNAAKFIGVFTPSISRDEFCETCEWALTEYRRTEREAERLFQRS